MAPYSDCDIWMGEKKVYSGEVRKKSLLTILLCLQPSPPRLIRDVGQRFLVGRLIRRGRRPPLRRATFGLSGRFLRGGRRPHLRGHLRPRRHAHVHLRPRPAQGW